MRNAARIACHVHNTRPPPMRGTIAGELAALFAAVAPDCYVEAPFHCAYGVNISLGSAVYLNAGCVVLDTASVVFCARSMCGPGVQVYCADHHRDPARRAEGIERALPVRIGEDVWIGGNAVLLPGITIGDGAIVGAGSVVTRDVAARSRVAGNPARGLPAS